MPYFPCKEHPRGGVLAGASKFMRFIHLYKFDIKYCFNKHDNLFSQMLCFDNYVFCNINNSDIDKIIKPCSVNIHMNNSAKVLCCKQNESTTSFHKNLVKKKYL